MIEKDSEDIEALDFLDFENQVSYEQEDISCDINDDECESCGS